MKKKMFNGKFGLTQAVLEGRICLAQKAKEELHETND
jgi:hypothetical protein